MCRWHDSQKAVAMVATLTEGLSLPWMLLSLSPCVLSQAQGLQQGPEPWSIFSVFGGIKESPPWQDIDLFASFFFPLWLG